MRSILNWLEPVRQHATWIVANKRRQSLKRRCQVAGSLLLAIALTGEAGIVHAEDGKTPDRDPQYELDGRVISAASSDERRIEFSMERAEAYLQTGAVSWTREKSCVSCHTNGTYLFVRPALTVSLGRPDGSVREFFVEELKQLQSFGREGLLESETGSAQAIYLAAGLAEWDRHVVGSLSDKTSAALKLVFDLQNERGTFQSAVCWPPLESSEFQEATMAVMAAAAAPKWRESISSETELVRKYDRLVEYVRETRAPHLYGRVLKLWASLRADGLMTKSQQESVIAELRKTQHADGGWALRDFGKPTEWGDGRRAAKLKAEPEFDSPASDGHMTGLAMIVLLESGVSAKDAQIQHGVKWIKANQRESGRWWTRSLNTDRQHYITYSGTAYPLLALQLAGALPDRK